MIAVIDIGSNSVRLMLWADGKTLYKRLKTTRLGAGVCRERRLEGEAMARSAEAVEEFFHEAKGAGARKIYAFATAAVRTALNGADFCDMVKRRTGLQVDVVDGGTEAMLAVRGALGDGDGVVIDVGGASSEVCFVRGGSAVFSHSFPLGAVTLKELCRDDARQCAFHVGKTFRGLIERQAGERVYAVGGTASTLVSLDLKLEKYDAERTNHHFMKLDAVEELKDKLFSLTLSERKELVGMEVGRADIIACGAGIFYEILSKICADGFYFSDRDNLEGYLSVRKIR